MPNALDRLRPELTALSPSECAEIAQFLLTTLDAEDDPDAEAAWDVELARRAEEIRLSRAIGTPAEEVFATIRERHS